MIEHYQDTVVKTIGEVEVRGNDVLGDTVNSSWLMAVLPM